MGWYGPYDVVHIMWSISYEPYDMVLKKRFATLKILKWLSVIILAHNFHNSGLRTPCWYCETFCNGPYNMVHILRTISYGPCHMIKSIWIEILNQKTKLYSNPAKTIIDDVILAIPTDDRPYQTYATTGLDMWHIICLYIKFGLHCRLLARLLKSYKQ